MATPIPKNRCVFTLGEAAAATGGRVLGDAGIRTTGVSIDTRTMSPGELFVALKGAGSDGHGFLAQAAERKAGAAVVTARRRHPALPCIEVADTLEALGRLAHHHLERTRAASDLPSIAIGGAAGKTTTKELTAAAAGALFGTTLATPGNLNNLIGVPMTLFMLQAGHHAIIIECGTNTRGEIPRLARIVEPDVAMVLNVDVEHTEGLGSLDDIADEEAALFDGVRRAAVTGADEPMVIARVPGHLRLLTFGDSKEADVKLALRKVISPGRSRITIALRGDLVQPGVSPVIESEIAMLGRAAALNCAAAVAGAAAMSAEPLNGGQLAAVGEALRMVNPVAGRLSTLVVNNVFVIDDTYNANPRSLRAALAAAREAADGLGAELVVALGDMLELGALAPAAHADAVREVMRVRPRTFVAVGAETSSAASAELGPSAAHPAQVIAVPDAAAAGEAIRKLLRPGDVLLVKGSRAIAMERVIEFLARS